MSAARKISNEPVYKQIVREIRSDVYNGKINPGDLLPSEAALSSQFGVSRETVRKGLNELNHQGFIYAQAGKGYYVAQPEHDQFILSFTDEEDGLVSKINSINVISPTSEVRSALNLSPGKKVIKITHVFLSSDTPVAFELRYLPYDKGLPLIESEIKYAVFPDIAALKTTPFALSTELEISAEFGDAKVQKALNCGPTDPLLVVYRYFIGEGSIRIGYGKKYIRPEYSRLCATSGYGQQT